MPLSRDMPAPVSATTLVDAASTSATSSMLALRVVLGGAPQSEEVKPPIAAAIWRGDTVLWGGCHVDAVCRIIGYSTTRQAMRVPAP